MANHIFLKNLKSIENTKIKELLENHQYNKIPTIVNTNGYNIDYDGVLLHNTTSPLGEAKGIFDKAQSGNQKINIVYGLGLGYLFQLTAKHTNGMVILYEPNIDILHFSLNLVDFSQDFSNKNVYLFCDLKEMTTFINNISKRDSKIDILSVESYRQMYKDTFFEDVKQIELSYGSTILDYSFKRKRLYQTTLNTVLNIPAILNETPINVLEGKYKNDVAIIVSAGPTLGENIELLKKYQENATIFSVGTAVKTLVKNDIKPDFLCIIEAYDCSAQVADVDVSDMNIILEPYTNKSIHNLPAKKKFLHFSENMPICDYLSKIIELDISGYHTQGTVSFMALNSAVNMGFKKIILVGQDLAYIDGQCYSKDSAYEDLVCKYNEETKKFEITPKDFEKYADALCKTDNISIKHKIAIDRLAILNGSMYTIKSVSGAMIPTEAGYASFIKHFADYAQSIDGVELVNTSLKGAQIDGFENKSLEEAFKNLTSLKVDKTEVEYTYEVEKIILGFEQSIKELSSKIEKCNESGKLISKLMMEIKRDKSVTKEKLLKIKTLIEAYTKMNDVSDRTNSLFMYSTSAEEMMLNDYLKTVKGYNEEVLLKTTNELKKYFETSKIKAERIKNTIKANLEAIR